VSFAKPEKPAPAPRRRIASRPKCLCEHAYAKHDESGCTAARDKYNEDTICLCTIYRPARSSVLRSPVARKKATEPKCAGCKHPQAMHRLEDGTESGCWVPRGGSGYCLCYVFLARKSAPARTKRPRKQRKGKRASIARECDRLWSLIVRSRGRSEISGSTENLQGAHGFSRSYKATRWLPLNGFALTQAEHVYFTYRPLEWDEHLRKSWGQPVYDELRAIALKNEKQDMPAVLAKLKAEAAARGIE
jgi:hypothetical protein